MARPAAPPSCAPGPCRMPSWRRTRTTANPGSSICAKPTRSRCTSIGERLLPETDPWFRQIVVSQGTFIELLVIALKQRGIEPQVTLFPEGEFAPRAARRSAGGPHQLDGAARAARDPLFAQLLKRHTAKVDYDTSRPVAAETSQRWRDVLTATRHVSYGATHRARRGCERCAGSAGKRPQVEVCDAAHGAGKHPAHPRRPGRDRPPSRRHQPQCAVAAPRRSPRRLRSRAAAGARAAPPIEQMMARFEGEATVRWVSSGFDAAMRRRDGTRRGSACRARLHAPAAEGDRARPAGAPDEPGGAGVCAR